MHNPAPERETMTMSSRLAATAPARKTHGLPCSISVALQQMPAKDRRALVAELERPQTDARFLSGRQIAEAIEAEGYGQIPPQQVGRHRRGDCRCTRSPK